MNEKIKELRNNSEKATHFFAKKLAFTLGPVELKRILDEEKVKIIDVRDKEDYEISHIPTSISIPEHELKDRLGELSEDEINIIYCYNILCHLGARAALTVAEAGYPVMHLDGGFKSWTEDFRFAVSS